MQSLLQLSKGKTCSFLCVYICFNFIFSVFLKVYYITPKMQTLNSEKEASSDRDVANKLYRSERRVGTNHHSECLPLHLKP